MRLMPFAWCEVRLGTQDRADDTKGDNGGVNDFSHF